MVGLQTAPSAWEVEALHRGLASVDIGVGGTFRQAVVASGRHTERSEAKQAGDCVLWRDSLSLLPNPHPHHQKKRAPPLVLKQQQPRSSRRHFVAFLHVSGEGKKRQEGRRAEPGSDELLADHGVLWPGLATR